TERVIGVLGIGAVDLACFTETEGALALLERGGEALELVVVASLHGHVREVLPRDAPGLVAVLSVAALLEDAREAPAAVIPIPVEIEQDGVVVVVNLAEL